MLLVWLIIGQTGILYAQDSYNVPASGNQTVTTCDAWIYDPGGANGNYSNNSDGYLVIYPNSANVKISIVSGSYNTESNCDKITIFSGVGTNGQQLAQWSGSGNVGNVISSTAANGALTIKFSSDYSIVKSGFALQVRCMETVTMSNTPLSGCGYVLLDPGGTSNYSNNQNVTQTICSPNGEKLQVLFRSFSLSNGDSLYVHDGGSTSGPLLGAFTGSTVPSQMVSTDSCVTFHFISNATGTSSGWQAVVGCAVCHEASTAPGSPCAFDNIHPFCTDQGQYTYYSGTSGDADGFFGSSDVACLSSTPAPVWYYMRVEQPGDLTIHIQQHHVNIPSWGIDVDFACWGPFVANTAADFIDNLCCGMYDLHKDDHPNNTSSTAHYPYGNLVDCSYDSAPTENCHITNAQTGQYYLLLITNYSELPGVITFNSTSNSTATTDCSIMAEVSNDGPYCVGDTIRLYCNNPQAGATYSWTGPNGWSSTSVNPIIYPATMAMDGDSYQLVKTYNGVSSNPVTTTVNVVSLDPSITAYPSNVVCVGDQVTLTAECNVISNAMLTGTCSNLWIPGDSDASTLTFTSTQPITYVLKQSYGHCVGYDTVSIEVLTPVTQIHASDTVICQGDTVTLSADCPDETAICAFQWTPGLMGTPAVQVTPNTTTSYVLQQTIDGCQAYDTVQIRVNHPSVNNDTIFRVITMDSLPYTFSGNTFGNVGTFDIHLTNAQDCDSLVTLVLSFPDTIRTSVDSVVCPDQFPLVWNGVTFHQDSSAFAYYTAQNGADSVVQMTVRHYPTPIQTVNVVADACAGDTLTVSIGTSSGSDVIISANAAVQSGSQKIFIPDGISCAPYGTFYRSIANFNQFLPGAVMTNVNDILYVRLKMEHSAMEDLKLSVVCPNGSRSKLVADYNNLTESWGNIPNNYFRTCFGLANRLTDNITCDSTQNPMGEPWNYIWSDNTNHNYQYAAGTYGYCYESVNLQSYANPYWDFNSPEQMYYDSYTTHKSVKPSNLSNMSQIYHPYQNFSSLIGCPLNGQWYIEIQDMLEQDNGYLTEWELALAPSLLQTVAPLVVSKQLIGPWVTRLTDSTFTITPPYDLSADTTASYQFVMQTDVGCLYDTTIQVTFHRNYALSLDTTVCDVELPFTWEGHTFTSDTNEVLNLQSAYGCDSLITLQVHVNPTYQFVDTVDTCDMYTWRDGVTYTESTDAPTITYTSESGCDSIVKLHLTIYHTIETVDVVSECDSFTWVNGITYYESTMDPVYVFARESGCDSTVRLHLTIGHSKQADTTVTACGKYTWYEHWEIQNSCDDLTHVFHKPDGCDSTVTLHLTILPLPEVCFDYYTLGDNYELGAILHFEECTPNMTNYHWDMGNSVTFEETAFDYMYEHSGTYKVTLMVTDENGCQNTHQRTVEIKEPEMQIFIPSSFTPNQDGLNEVLKPIGLHITDDHYLFVIYDRWGEVVFKTTNPEEGWDGKYKGSIVPNGSVMTYTLRCASEKGLERRKGMVVVVY
jgi:gliding motility-associated-like protein